MVAHGLSENEEALDVMPSSTDEERIEGDYFDEGVRGNHITERKHK